MTLMNEKLPKTWQQKLAATTSVTRLDDFWNFSVTNFLTRGAKIVGKLLGYFERDQFYVNLLRIHFGLLSVKIGLLLIPTSGHTGYNMIMWFQDAQPDHSQSPTVWALFEYQQIDECQIKYVHNSPTKRLNRLGKTSFHASLPN